MSVLLMPLFVGSKARGVGALVNELLLRGNMLSELLLGVNGSIFTLEPVNNDGRRPFAGVELGVLATDNELAAIPPPDDDTVVRAIGDDTVATANNVR
jgi:hypothetical protein